LLARGPAYLDARRTTEPLPRAFVAKAVIGLPTTSMLIDQLAVDKRLRRLCGWERPGQVPSESTELPSRVQ
jgi:hypothetical protein